MDERLIVALEKIADALDRIANSHGVKSKDKES